MLVDDMIQTFVEPPLENNNYVIIDEDEAALIDCSAPDPAVLAYIKGQGAHLKYILLTHGHFDHILGVSVLKQQTGATVAVHPSDRPLIGDVSRWTEQILHQKTDEIPAPDLDLSDGMHLRVGKTDIQVLHTPGHTAGGVCFLIGKNLFAGDTLFRGSHGRTDLPGGDEALMQKSLKKLLLLPADTVVYAGHGSATSIGAERENISALCG